MVVRVYALLASAMLTWLALNPTGLQRIRNGMTGLPFAWIGLPISLQSGHSALPVPTIIRPVALRVLVAVRFCMGSPDGLALFWILSGPLARLDCRAKLADRLWVEFPIPTLLKTKLANQFGMVTSGTFLLRGRHRAYVNRALILPTFSATNSHAPSYHTLAQD